GAAAFGPASHPGAIHFEAVEVESVQRQPRAVRLKLRTRPIHDTSSARMLAIADAAEIAVVLDGRQALKLGVPQLLLNVPMRGPVTRRIAEGALQTRHGSVDRAFAQARHAGQSVPRSSGESVTISSGGYWTCKSCDYRIGEIIDCGHGRRASRCAKLKP